MQTETTLKPLAVRPSTASKMLDCSVTKVYDLIKQGKLRTVPFGADQRIPLSELEGLLAK